MIEKVIDDRVEIYIPECSCNKKHNWVKWKHSELVPEENAEKYAQVHEEIHELAHKIIKFMDKTGKMDRESVIEEFGDEYRVPLIVIAATLILSPIKFPRRRRAHPAVYNEIRNEAKKITYRYLEMKEFDEEEDCYCDTHDDVTCEYHGYFY